MELLTAKILEDMCNQNKKQFEGLLPEIVKRLILASNSSVREHRFPAGDDVWAPGFDGVLNCMESSKYVRAGMSVWEFGTNSDSLSKINDDYEKRTKNPLGYKKEETGFYLVVTRIWAFKGVSIKQWEDQHDDWAYTKVFDAVELSEWINSEPTVCAWLFETIYGASDIEFSSVEQAWNRFVQKTKPRFTREMFVLCRQEQEKEFLSRLRDGSEDIVIKGATTIDSIGFVLAVLLSDEVYAQNCIVVNNVQTFKMVASMAKDKLILLNYSHEGELFNQQNRIILCLNKEAISANNAIELPLLTKSLYELALKDMGIEDSKISDLFAFTHGNLRALIRRIPGSLVDTKPGWAKQECLDALVPLVLLRSIDIEKDKGLVERLANMSFANVDKVYHSLSLLEDTPVKVVPNHYVIVNYEEAWDTLSLSTSEYHFDLLMELLEDMLDSLSKAGEFENRSLYEYKDIIRRLLWNMIYYSYEDDYGKLRHAIERILEYSYQSKVSKAVIGNWSSLAIACPEAVMDFISNDYSREDGIIKSIFNGDDYDNQYCDVLFALDDLAIHYETLPGVCKILFDLYLIKKKYIYNNSPKESLLVALCLWRCEGTVTLSQKEAIIMNLLNKNDEAVELFAELIRKDSYHKGVRIGEEQIQGETISVRDLVLAKQRILEALFIKGIKSGKASAVLSLFEDYRDINPTVLGNYAENFDLHLFTEEDVEKLNYWLRKKIYNIKRFGWQDCEKYIASLEKWISATEYKDAYKDARWAFKDSYECPTKELLSSADDYDQHDMDCYQFRKALLEKLLSDNREKAITMVTNCISDEPYWGKMLAEFGSADMFDFICCRLSEEHKYLALARFLDDSEVEKVKAFLETIGEIKVEIVPHLYNKELLSCLKTEDVYLFWKNKTMLKYVKEDFEALLKYNPKGLVTFLYLESEKNPNQCVDLAKDVFKALQDDKENVNNHADYEIEAIISKIDSVYYSDDWAELCMRLSEKMESDSYPECICKYLFYNPNKIRNILLDGGIKRYKFINDYRLPECAYKEYSAFKFFFDALRTIEIENNLGWSVIGAIMGKSAVGTDGFFPHEFVRMILEDYASKDLDDEVVYSFEDLNKIRAVSDGNDQLRKAHECMNISNRFLIDFPHSAYILKKISSVYTGNAKRDYIHSEVMLY